MYYLPSDCLGGPFFHNYASHAEVIRMVKGCLFCRHEGSLPFNRQKKNLNKERATQKKKVFFNKTYWAFYWLFIGFCGVVEHTCVLK